MHVWMYPEVPSNVEYALSNLEYAPPSIGEYEEWCFKLVLLFLYMLLLRWRWGWYCAVCGNAEEPLDGLAGYIFAGAFFFCRNSFLAAEAKGLAMAFSGSAASLRGCTALALLVRWFFCFCFSFSFS